MRLDIAVDPDRGLVYEHGWQSWSPTTTYPVTATGHRPMNAASQIIGYRPGARPRDAGFQGEGLLAVAPAPGEPVHVFAATSPEAVPSIAGSLGASGRFTVEADGEIAEHVFDAPLQAALGAWAQRFAPRVELRPAPTVWCSWYHYYGGVTEADIVENLEALGAHDLPVDVVQIDDGWQAGIGDWLTLSDRFGSLADISARIRAAGRRPGIWVAPFLVGAKSELARREPGWLLENIGQGWDQPLSALDITRPGAAGYLTEVFESLAAHFDYFKVDFLYAGALRGLDVYRDSMRLIRRAIGPEPYLVGCGAPILPSVGLVDAMRVGPDIAPHYEPLVPDMSSYSQRTAAMSTIGRAWQHGRFWVNDPDCLLARPQMERREEWADVVRKYGGLRASSDRIADLDPWGLSVTRELLTDVPPPTPFVLELV